MGVNADVQLLQQVPMFKGADPSHLQTLVFSAGRKKFEAGKYIFRAGKSGSTAYLLLDGQAEILSVEGEVIANARRGAFLGELHMISRGVYTCSARTVKISHVLVISNKLFFRVCDEFPQVGKVALNYLSQKLDVSLEELRSVQDYFENAESFSDL